MKGVLLMLLLTLGLPTLSESGLYAQEITESGSELTISVAHSLFGRQCALCHEPFRGTSEKLCLGCHAGPPHNTVQAFTPPCVSCHVEHKGQEKLARVTNTQCVTCHAELQGKEGHAVEFARSVTSFMRNHPEFAITVQDGTTLKRIPLDGSGARQSDRARLTFPHEKHLQPDLKSPKGKVQLACQDCHALAADGRQIAPVSYLTHCQRCHPLGFDSRFPDRVVPHASPQEVHAYLIMTYAERHQEKLPSPPRFGRLTRPVPSVAPLNITPSVFQQVAAAEKYIYLNGVMCDKCHVLVKNERALPEIEPTAIPVVWLPHARFAHKPHRMMECAACHADVTKSNKSTDILLPGIQVCQECHRAAARSEVAQQQYSATTDCVACHLYHDQSGGVDWKGSFTIPRLLTEGQLKRIKKRRTPLQTPEGN